MEGLPPAAGESARRRESVPGNPALRTQAANKKLRSCSLPPPPRRAPRERVFCRNATSSTRSSRSALRLLTWPGEARLQRPGPATRQRAEEGLDRAAKSERGHLVTLARPRGMHRRHRAGGPRGRSIPGPPSSSQLWLLPYQESPRGLPGRPVEMPAHTSRFFLHSCPSAFPWP